MRAKPNEAIEGKQTSKQTHKHTNTQTHKQTANMCKASPPSPPSTEVADEIKNTTVVDSSWSFINIHLPSAVTTTIVIIIILISTLALLRIFSRFAKARQSTDPTRPGPGSTISTPATWPSAPPSPSSTWPSTTPPPLTSIAHDLTRVTIDWTDIGQNG